MRTKFLKPTEIERKWYIIDAQDKVLGRVAVRVASILQGKHKPTYTPNMEHGDFVVVINAGKVDVTGRKRTDKMYWRHTGFPGGIKSETFEKRIRRRPEAPLEDAIRGMLPKNRLGRKLFKNVKVYAGSTHPHAAQTPEELSL
ncbi:MAG: 50S ribosomal protein L13 [Spirochaetaceae bacterium]|nr:MAG: 50S ribosomal protein L13 [Spirochaetaceae bacterium]